MVAMCAGEGLVAPESILGKISGFRNDNIANGRKAVMNGRDLTPTAVFPIVVLVDRRAPSKSARKTSFSKGFASHKRIFWVLIVGTVVATP